MIPIQFLTGFYVAEVVRRYWDQFMCLPYPDRLALKLVAYIPGKVSNRNFPNIKALYSMYLVPTTVDGAISCFLM